MDAPGIQIVSLAEVKKQLRVYDDSQDDEIDQIRVSAQIAVCDYIGKPEGYTGTGDDNPRAVVAPAILLMAAWLWGNSGDDSDDMSQAEGYLPKPVTMLLHRTRKQVVA